MSAAPAPGTPEWARVVSASKVADILGLSPWGSPRKMWHQMRGDIPWDEESRPMRRGNMLENAVLDWWLADNPEWEEVERQPVYRLDGEDWCLATPDMLVRHRETGEHMLVDAKTTSRDWDWQVEVPAYYAASSMFQLAMAHQVPRVCLAVLFGDPFDLRSYYIDRDDELIDGLLTRCREFYDSLTDDDAGPALSGMTCEYDAIRKAHPDIDKGERADIDPDLAAEYLAAQAASKSLKGLQARVLDQMGRAQYGVVGDIRIARRQASGEAVALYCTAKPTDLTQGAAA